MGRGVCDIGCIVPMAHYELRVHISHQTPPEYHTQWLLQAPVRRMFAPLCHRTRKLTPQLLLESGWAYLIDSVEFSLAYGAVVVLMRVGGQPWGVLRVDQET